MLISEMLLAKSRTIAILVCAVAAFINAETALAKRSQIKNTGSVFVSPSAKNKLIKKVAVLPFKAPVELAGASIADVFTTEVLRTYKYQLIERSQMEQVLDEKALGMQGVISSSEAIQIGKLLGVEGVILGTVPEYGLRAQGEDQLPSVGINVRMISVDDGSIVWSASDSAVGEARDPLPAFSAQLVQRTIAQLQSEWIRTGDTIAVNLPTAEAHQVIPGIREIKIQFLPVSKNIFTDYRIYHSRTKNGNYTLHSTIKNSGGSRLATFTHSKLLDAETYYYKVAGVAPTGLNGLPNGPYEATTIGPPAAVEGFLAQSARARKVPLSWRQSLDPNVKGYNIYRSRSENSGFQKIAFVRGAKKSEYLDKGGRGKPSLEDLTDYYYRIHSVNVVDVESAGSLVIAAKTKPVPDPVQNFSVESNQVKQVTISWDANAEPDIKSYRIFSGTSATNVKRKLKDVAGNNTQYVHGRLKDGNSYFYAIQAIDVDGLQSKRSEVVLAATKPRPGTPTGLKANFDDDRIVLSWYANSESDIEGYEIKSSGGFQLVKGPTTVLTSDTEYVFDNLKSGATAKFKIKAIDQTDLSSDYAQQVTVKIPEQESSNE